MPLHTLYYRIGYLSPLVSNRKRRQNLTTATEINCTVFNSATLDPRLEGIKEEILIRTFSTIGLCSGIQSYIEVSPVKTIPHVTSPQG